MHTATKGPARLAKRVMIRLYRLPSGRLKAAIRWLVSKAEGGEVYSATLREIFSRYHNVHIGMYTLGACFKVGAVDRHTNIGRYCSIARTARVHNRNHPLERKSTHPFFYNPVLRCCSGNSVPYIPLDIGSDVWIGHNAVIMPHVRQIGHGAVVAAGAVVSNDVPPYAVVVGNPARVVRYRFPPAIIQRLLAEKWWERSIEELLPDLAEYLSEYAPSNGFERDAAVRDLSGAAR